MTVLLYPQRRSPKAIGGVLGIAYIRSSWQATPPSGVVIVCTSGVWSSTISFLPCDDFRIIIDGPSLDEPDISVTMELQE